MERERGGVRTHPTYNLVMVGKMGLALLAPVDLLGVEVDVVGEAHASSWADGRSAYTLLTEELGS